MIIEDKLYGLKIIYLFLHLIIVNNNYNPIVYGIINLLNVKFIRSKNK